MRTLLVIDDNASVREAFKFVLSRRGYAVLVAEDGPEGIAIASAHPIDGVLIDVQMPGMDGFEVCRELGRMAVERGRKIPRWIMTGGRSQQLQRLAAEAGALNLFTKPFDFAQLCEAIEADIRAAETSTPTRSDQ